MDTVVIVNPEAGNGRTKIIWPQMKPLLNRSIGSFKILFTSGRGSATNLCRQALEMGAFRIVAVGGDGLLNEVLNGFIENDVQFNPKSKLSFVMTGTGCDFQRSLGISGNWEIAVKNLKDAKLRQIDIGKVKYATPDKNEKIRYFVNIASFGLSGAVNFYIENSKFRRFLGSTILFLFATLKTVFSYPNQTIYYSIDGITKDEIKTRLVLLANGRFFGGAMNAAPEAELDDGLLDLLILKEISLGKFLWHLPKIYKGKHLYIPEVIFKKIRKFSASSPEQVILDIDGESPGYLDATFEVLPNVLNLQI